MPRVSICINKEEEKIKGDRWSPENEHYDFCKECLSVDKEKCVDVIVELLVEKHPDIDVEIIEQEVKDGMNGGCEHPPYEDTDYACEFCENELTEEDN